jgi:hypothetical protein
MGGRLAKALGALIAVLVLVLGAGVAAGAIRVAPGSTMQAKTSTSFVPRTLAKNAQTPIVLRSSSRFWMEDGSQVPALRGYRMQLDRQMRLDLAEVPVCSGGFRSRVRGEGVPDECRDSIAGQASMKVDVRFPEAAPVVVTGEGAIVRGPAKEGGGPRLFLHTYLEAPVTGEIVVPLEVERTPQGLYGLQMEATFPKIAGGSGSVVHLAMRFRRGVFTASCPASGRLAINQRAWFDDRSLWGGVTTFGACRSSN